MIKYTYECDRCKCLVDNALKIVRLRTFHYDNTNREDKIIDRKDLCESCREGLINFLNYVNK